MLISQYILNLAASFCTHFASEEFQGQGQGQSTVKESLSRES
jgi:hypothetical protein